MAKKIYTRKNVTLLNGVTLEISPLKIKYLHEFMEKFSNIYNAKNDAESISILIDCVRIAMKQYYPELSLSVEAVEDCVNMPILEAILEASANIKINEKSEETVKNQATESASTWEDLDLAKLESEVFLVGIWKDYNELEESLSMPELIATLEIKRELDYEEKKFLAAVQGIDLEEQINPDKGQKEWEDLKARVFSKGQANDSKDILALQGENARQVGFGINMGLDYEDLRDPNLIQ